MKELEREEKLPGRASGGLSKCLSLGFTGFGGKGLWRRLTVEFEGEVQDSQFLHSLQFSLILSSLIIKPFLRRRRSVFPSSSSWWWWWWFCCNGFLGSHLPCCNHCLAALPPALCLEVFFSTFPFLPFPPLHCFSFSISLTFKLFSAYQTNLK